MKVLLTGASGFLGKYILKQLSARGINTVAAVRSLPENSQPTDFIQADLLSGCDFGDLIAKAEATHLLHIAWYAEHGAYWTSPLNLRWTEASIKLAEAFCDSKNAQHVVMAGTCAEYDWSYGYCSEDLTPLQPATLYGVAKDATRRLVSAICDKHHIPFAWGRVFLPYGHGEDARRLIPSLISVFQGAREPFGINASAYRDFLHADDVASAFIKLIECDATGIFNLCSGIPVRLEDVVNRIAYSFNEDPQIVLGLSASRLGEPRLLVGNNQKLCDLGWTARYSVLSDLTS